MRNGDPAQWENETHPKLRPNELQILRLGSTPGEFTADDMLQRGYQPPSHRSCWCWLMKLQRQGLIERSPGGTIARFVLADYGRWMLNRARSLT